MVNWSVFESLPGDVTNNFELLCRSLVWLNYGRFGSFKALANQPGIEFDLALNEDCSLGKSGKKFGWQCRWYGIQSGVAIGKTRRNKIQEALDKTIATIPDITDWVLWTRHPLTKGDQKWFYNLSSSINLHLWTTHEAETLLCGDAEILRQTYFGDLILTPTTLAQLHEVSVAPIKKRWLPEVHQIVDTERTLRQMLGHSYYWSDLLDFATDLKHSVEILRSELGKLPDSLLSLTSAFIGQLEKLTTDLVNAYDLIEKSDFQLLIQFLLCRKTVTDPCILAVPRKLRGARLACGLIATNALADFMDSNALLEDIVQFLETRIVAIVADAGSGKTQLSAGLTADQENRPAGILLFGRSLSARSTLDDLAKTININGNPVPSMQALLAALNAAGERSKCRLPLIIDGLNEAEDPRQWKPLLAAIQVHLKQYPNILVICTLRSGVGRKLTKRSTYHDTRSATSSFVNQALPENIEKLEIADFEDDTSNAISKYFNHFKISADINELPFQLLSHPLTLRIFCEVTNPDRNKIVGMEAIPRSLASMFDRYVMQAAERIEELSPYDHRHFQQDILNSLDTFGQQLWSNKCRELAERNFRIDINDDKRQWNNSVITLLEQEGLLLRMPGESPTAENIVPVYDLFGGYLIAKALILQIGRNGMQVWINDSATMEALRGDYSVRHPLSEDIFRFLVALMPKYLHQQLWQIIGESLRMDALELATLLEGQYLDNATIEAITDSINNEKESASLFFRRIIGVRSATKHPLNADFIDKLLRNLEVSQRDLIWSEWLRRNEDKLLKDVERSIAGWISNIENHCNSDILKAKWYMWMLTTTIHRLRIKTTLALYWFGRGDAIGLFELTESAVEINDPYVFERMLAASYGAAMALCTEAKQESFRAEVLPKFAKRLFDVLFQVDAPARTTHTLIREYARGIIELAKLYNPDLLSSFELSSCSSPYPNGGRIKWQSIRINNKKLKYGESPFRMDFENYTIGTLVKGRSNYDYDNKNYKKVRSQILWRIYNLGWNSSDFQEVDKTIETSRNSYSRHDDDLNKTDRYGKKYSWIAYHELKGWLKDRGALDTDFEDGNRDWDFDIDPCFPLHPIENKLIHSDFLGDPNINLQDWIDTGDIADFSDHFYHESVNGETGPWIILDGHINQQDERRGRSIFASIRTFLVPKKEKQSIISLLEKQDIGGRWLPEKREFHNVFSGEIPWIDVFEDSGKISIDFVTEEYPVKVKEEQEVYYLDGERIELSFLDTLRFSNIHLPSILGDSQERFSEEDFARIQIRKEQVETVKIEKKTKSFDVIQPVCDLKTVGKTLTDVSGGGTTLTREIAQLVDLINIPQTFDLKTKDGVRATIQNAYRISSYKNSERLFFIRKEILNAILEKQDVSLVFAVWGERKLSLGQFESRNDSDGDHGKSYAGFQSIHDYDNIEITK